MSPLHRATTTHKALTLAEKKKEKKKRLTKVQNGISQLMVHVFNRYDLEQGDAVISQGTT